MDNLHHSTRCLGQFSLWRGEFHQTYCNLLTCLSCPPLPRCFFSLKELSLQEICQLVTLHIGHWKVTFFHLWPFCDQKQLVKRWASLMKLRDLLGKLVINVCDQKKGHRFYDQFIWSLTIRTDHVRSNVVELTWQNSDQTKWSQIRISPILFSHLYGPSLIIRPI